MPKKKYRPEQIVTLLGQIELSYKTDTSSSTEILASRGILRTKNFFDVQISKRKEVLQ